MSLRSVSLHLVSSTSIQNFWYQKISGKRHQQKFVEKIFVNQVIISGPLLFKPLFYKWQRTTTSTTMVWWAEFIFVWDKIKMKLANFISTQKAVEYQVCGCVVVEKQLSTCSPLGKDSVCKRKRNYYYSGPIAFRINSCTRIPAANFNILPKFEGIPITGFVDVSQN